MVRGCIPAARDPFRPMRTLFKQQHIDPAAAQFSRKGQAGWSGPGHDDGGRGSLRGHTYLQTRTNVSA